MTSKIPQTTLLTRARLDRDEGEHSDIKVPISVSICAGPNCELKKADALAAALLDKVEAKGWERHVEVGSCSCFGKCKDAPSVRVNQMILSKAGLDQVSQVIEHELLKLPLRRQQ